MNFRKAASVVALAGCMAMPLWAQEAEAGKDEADAKSTVKKVAEETESAEEAVETLAEALKRIRKELDDSGKGNPVNPGRFPNGGLDEEAKKAIEEALKELERLTKEAEEEAGEIGESTKEVEKSYESEDGKVKTHVKIVVKTSSSSNKTEKKNDSERDDGKAPEGEAPGKIGK